MNEASINSKRLIIKRMRDILGVGVAIDYEELHLLILALCDSLEECLKEIGEIK